MSETVPLAHQISGDDAAPALVFLHGLYGAGNNWRGITPAFITAYQVILPDLRSHGRSPHHPRMDYRDMAADVVALLQAKGITKAHVVGHSMGGKVAMAMALTAPDRVAKLAVVDIAPIAYDHAHEHGGIIQAMETMDLASLRDRRDADAALAKDIAEPVVRQFLLTNLEHSNQGWQWRLPLSILADQLGVLEGWPTMTAAAWQGNAYFMYGGASDYVEDEGRRAIKTFFPTAELECFNEAGHWVHAEARADFTQRLSEFLAKDNKN